MDAYFHTHTKWLVIQARMDRRKTEKYIKKQNVMIFSPEPILTPW